MNKQKGLAPVLIIILIALAVGGILLYQKQFKSVAVPQPSSQPSPVPAVSDASPVPNGTGETSNWKTYTSNRFPYIFKYPPSYVVQESFNPNGNIYSTTISNTDSKLFASGKKNVSDRDVFNMIIRNPSSDVLPEWPDAQKSKISDYSIDGQTGIKYNQNDVVVLYKNKEYVFHLLSTNTQFKSDFARILSTFKFLP